MLVVFCAAGAFCGSIAARGFLQQSGARTAVSHLLGLESFGTGALCWVGTLLFLLLLALCGLLRAGKPSYCMLFFCKCFFLGYALVCGQSGGYEGTLRMLCALAFPALFLLPAQLYTACVCDGSTDARLKAPSARAALCVNLLAVAAALAGKTFLTPLWMKMLS